MYHPPKFYDLSYSFDMRDERTFLARIFRDYATVKYPRVLEPACGTGRLVVSLTRAGFRCTGFDTNPAAIDYLKKNCGVTVLMQHVMWMIFRTSPFQVRNSTGLIVL